ESALRRGARAGGDRYRSENLWHDRRKPGNDIGENGWSRRRGRVDRQHHHRQTVSHRQTRGIVEVRCVQHPWTHAYIAVFDHPYFDVTEDDGSFKIDSLPPGTYTVNLWHEGMAKPVTQSVNIAANGTARIDLPIKLQ